MGIAKDVYQLLARLSREVGFEDSEILTLGRQSGILTIRQMVHLNQKFGLEGSFKPKEVSGFDAYKNHPTDKQIFQSLGFKSLESLDSHPYEGATIIHDLNEPITVPSGLGQYDVIFDGGTSEHIFDQLKVLENLNKLCRVGGVIIHWTPANNCLDHGYFQPSPSFYREYYEANDFEIIQSYLVELGAGWGGRRPVFKYETMRFEYVSFGGHWSRKMLANWFVVRKKESSSSLRVPQQVRSTRNHESEDSITVFSGGLGVIQRFLHAHPNLRFVALGFLSGLRRLRWLSVNGIKRRPRPIFFV